MSLKGYRPAERLLKVLCIAFVFSVVQLFYPDLEWMTLGACIILLIVFLADFLSLFRLPNIEFERLASQTLPLGVASKIHLNLRNMSAQSLNFELVELLN